MRDGIDELGLVSTKHKIIHTNCGKINQMGII